MTAADVIGEYEARLAARRSTLDRWERWHARFSYARLGLAAIAIAILVSSGMAALWSVLLLLALFMSLVIAHARLLNARDRAQSAVEFYERGLARLKFEWIGHGDSGERFRPADHLYADDLDLFGRGSLFELVGTCRTEAGRATLARWLLAPSPPDVVRSRQAAVRELAPKIDLRETVGVKGDGLPGRVDPVALGAWATAPAELKASLRPLVIGLTAALTAATAWSLAGGSTRFELVVLIAQSLTGLALMKRVHRVVEGVEAPVRDLDLFAALTAIIEKETFASPHLQALRQSLISGERPASANIARLAHFATLLASRSNVIFAIVSPLLMWATHCAFAIERWRRIHGANVPRWLGAVGEFEALAALGAYAFEHPGYVYPDITPGPAHIAATALAHPLLPSNAVANDVALGGAAPSLLVVSGSNMSGKSTFLRALGLNVVLAQAGGPVRATTCRLSPLYTGASIRVLDSLQEGHSRFYAEILRFKHVVDLARQHNGAVLFLLDEVLSGTNSHDRREGAEGLLCGLIDLGTIGLATTHDMALGEIATGLAPRAANVHFSDTFHDGRLVFDYQLREGPVRSSNALALMRAVGLDV